MRGWGGGGGGEGESRHFSLSEKESVSLHTSKHLGVRQKYSVEHRIINSLLGDCKCDETLSLVFDIIITSRTTVLEDYTQQVCYIINL